VVVALFYESERVAELPIAESDLLR